MERIRKNSMLFLILCLSIQVSGVQAQQPIQDPGYSISTSVEQPKNNETVVPEPVREEPIQEAPQKAAKVLLTPDERQPIQVAPEKMKETQKELGVEDLVNERISGVGVAIIDDGFGDPDYYSQDLPGVQVKVIGKDSAYDEYLEKLGEEKFKQYGLPLNKNYYPSLELPAPQKATRATVAHGMMVLQSMLQVIGYNTGVTFYLLNGNTPFNYVAAHLYAEKLFLDKKIRTIVNSTLARYGGAGDGTGPVDRIVEEILRNPELTYFQAAGNDGDRTWSGKAKRMSQSQYIQFRSNDKETGHCLRFKNLQPDNEVTVILEWNGRQKSIWDGTLIDYDLQILDPRGNPVGEGSPKIENGEIAREQDGTEVQVKDFDATIGFTNRANFSRESVLLKIPRVTKGGDYCIRVKAVSDATRETDNLQVIVRTKPIVTDEGSESVSYTVDFKDANQQNEMLSPATARNVISVGNLGSYSSRAVDSDGRQLPVAHIGQDKLYLQDGRFYQGTSFSAPMLAAVKVLLEIKYPKIDHDSFLKLLSDEPGPVTLDYLRKNHRQGTRLLMDLLTPIDALNNRSPRRIIKETNGVTEVSTLKESDLKAFIYPGGITIVTIPEYAPLYKDLVPGFPLAQEMMHLDSFDYLIGTMSYYPGDGTEVPRTFTTWRSRDRGEPYPWNNKAWETPGKRKFDPEDFIILEKEMSFEELKQRRRPDLKLREGNGRDVPRKTFFGKLDTEFAEKVLN